MAKQTVTVTLDMTGERLINLGSAVDGTDAVNKNDLDGAGIDSLNAAKAYADTGDAATLTAANNHSDTNDTATLAAAVDYTDNAVAGLATVVYVDSQDAATLASANSHSDTNDAQTLSDANAYTDTQIASNAVPAASETVAGKVELSTQAETNAESNDATAVTPLKLATYIAAKGFATTSAMNAGDSSTLTSAMNYTDSAIAAAAVPAASESVAGKIEIATQAETNTATDDLRAVTPLKLAAKIASYSFATISYVDSGDASTLSSAHTYTDNQIAAAAVPDASTTVKGKIEIATQTEVDTGTDAVRAVVPATLAPYVAAAVAGVTVPDASETVKGKIEIATQAETNAGTDDVRAVTPLKLAGAVASTVPSFVPDGAPRNILLNADGRVHQRKNSSGADLAFGQDCWHGLIQTGSMEFSGMTATNIADEMPFALTIGNFSGSATRIGQAQVVDSDRCRRLRGQTVVVSGKARLTNTANLRWAVFEWTGTADAVPKELVNTWTSTNYTTGNFFVNTAGLTLLLVSGSEAFTANTVKSVAEATVTFGSSMNNLVFFYWTEGTVASGTEIASRWQVEKGSRASSFDHRPFAEVLAAVKRYYRKSFKYTAQPAQGSNNFVGAVFAYGATTSTTTGPHATVGFDNEMCKTPTITLYGPGSASDTNWRRHDDGAVGPSSSSSQASTSGFNVDCTGAPSTQGTFAIHWTAEATPTS